MPKNVAIESVIHILYDLSSEKYRNVTFLSHTYGLISEGFLYCVMSDELQGNALRPCMYVFGGSSFVSQTTRSRATRQAVGRADFALVPLHRTLSFSI